METNKSTVIVPMLIGAAAGLVLGILFAPDDGKSTRKKIKTKVLDTTHELSDHIVHAKDEITKFAKFKKAEFDKKMENTVSNLSHKAENILETLEEKLEDLRSKNATFQK